MNPATSEVFDEVPSASPEDAARALDIAARGRLSWARVPLHERVTAIHSFLELPGKPSEMARQILVSKRAKLNELARKLIEVETLEGDELQAFMAAASA